MYNLPSHLLTSNPKKYVQSSKLLAQMTSSKVLWTGLFREIFKIDLNNIPFWQLKQKKKGNLFYFKVKPASYPRFIQI